MVPSILSNRSQCHGSIQFGCSCLESSSSWHKEPQDVYESELPVASTGQGWTRAGMRASQVCWPPKGWPHLVTLWGKTRKHPLYSPPTKPLNPWGAAGSGNVSWMKKIRGNFLEYLIYVISWVVKHHFSQFTLCWSLTCVSNIKEWYLKCSLY